MSFQYGDLIDELLIAIVEKFSIGLERHMKPWRNAQHELSIFHLFSPWILVYDKHKQLAIDFIELCPEVTSIVDEIE